MSVNKLCFKNITSNNIIFFGDIHGEFETLLFRIKRDAKDFKDTILIILGDCGIGFYKEQYYRNLFNKMNNIFKNIGTTLIMFRGNHDDPSYYDGITLNYSNIKVIPDYTVIETCKRNILCIGGGLSVDRVQRLQEEKKYNKYGHHRSLYWANELPVYDEIKLNEIRDEKISIDVIASHTAPSFFPFKDDRYIESYLNIDDKLVDDLIKERGTMDKIYEYVTAFFGTKYWFYGHFHEYQMGQYEKMVYQMMPNIDDIKSFNKSLEELINENN